jgi:hypothetical protein
MEAPKTDKVEDKTMETWPMDILREGYMHD